MRNRVLRWPRLALISCWISAATGATSAQSAATVPSRAAPTCQLITTGGTIAMKRDATTGAPVPALSGEDLLASVPELAKVATVRVENLFNIPSGYIDPAHWVTLRASVARALDREDVAGVIVTHGTDTMEETAYFLDLTVRSDKPVILVGAQRNASESDFDGPRNLLNAARICVAPEARGRGTVIALNGEINAAREATKTHTSNVETFKSGDAGFLGVVDVDRVIYQRAPLRRQYVELTGTALPRVDVIPMYAGADAALLRAAVAAGAKGIVVQALGWGNVNVPMFEAIKQTIGSGVPVVIATRVPQGRVLPVYGYAGGGKTLSDAGAIFADDLSPQKARILLMLALQKTHDAASLQQLFNR